MKDGIVEQAEALPSAWRAPLASFFSSAVFQSLAQFIEGRKADGHVVYPDSVFRALELTRPDTIRAVILGQDPYHGPRQAHGLAFSVQDGIAFPPSLRNIFKELQSDVGCSRPSSGNLEPWARQGVLLLNTVLTVEAGQAGSHAKRGWEALTDLIIQTVAADAKPKVFMLWGGPAQTKRGFVKDPHAVLAANHPSPLAAARPPVPFIGCRHFSRANAWLKERGLAEIDWCLP